MTFEEGFRAALEERDAGNYEKSLDILLQLAKERPKSASVYGILGDVYSLRRDLASAITAFEQATQLSPQSELASLGLFHTLWEAKLPREALKEMNRFRALAQSEEYDTIAADLLPQEKRLAGEGTHGAMPSRPNRMNSEAMMPIPLESAGFFDDPRRAGFPDKSGAESVVQQASREFLNALERLRRDFASLADEMDGEALPEPASITKYDNRLKLILEGYERATDWIRRRFRGAAPMHLEFIDLYCFQLNEHREKLQFDLRSGILGPEDRTPAERLRAWQSLAEMDKNTVRDRIARMFTHQAAPDARRAEQSVREMIYEFYRIESQWADETPTTDSARHSVSDPNSGRKDGSHETI